MDRPPEKKKKSDLVIRIIIIITVLAALLLVALVNYENRQTLVYKDHLEDVCVTIDDEALTLSDLAFYIAYVERTVEEDAIIYDDENTRAFWNIHTNQTFTQTAAKETAMNMAIHDHIFYRLALDCHMVLSEEEAMELENSRTDFWEDLLDVQRERMPVSYEVINETIKEIALAEKYQWKLAEENDATYAAFSYDGYDYKTLLETYDVRINSAVWDKVNVGNVTLVHEDIITLN